MGWFTLYRALYVIHPIIIEIIIQFQWKTIIKSPNWLHYIQTQSINRIQGGSMRFSMPELILEIN